MENLPYNSSSLELTIAMPGFSFTPSNFPSSAGENYNDGGGTMKEVLDINRVPSSGLTEDECMEEEDESPNSNGGHAHAHAPRKKLRLTKQQSRLLEETFRLNHTLNPKEKESLAEQLKLKPRQVEVWFQNRRARSKLKQTEMEFEYLKRWFGSLTEQNRKLQKEVEELRAMKVEQPQHHGHGRQYPMTAPSTLTTTSTNLGRLDKLGPAAATCSNMPFQQPSAAAACQH